VIKTSIIKPKPIIAIDVDDVLGDYMSKAIEYGNARFGTNLTSNDGAESWIEMFGVSPEQWVEGFNDFCEKTKWYRNEKPMLGAREVLEKLKANFKLVVVTSRGMELKQGTLEWLDENYGSVIDEVFFSGIYDNVDEAEDLHGLAKLTKADKLQEIGVSYLIDDQPKHVNGAAELGIESLLFGDYGWSRDVEIVDGVTRVADWGGVAKYFGVE